MTIWDNSPEDTRILKKMARIEFLVRRIRYSTLFIILTSLAAFMIIAAWR